MGCKLLDGHAAHAEQLRLLAEAQPRVAAQGISGRVRQLPGPVQSRAFDACYDVLPWCDLISSSSCFING